MRAGKNPLRFPTSPRLGLQACTPTLPPVSTAPLKLIQALLPPDHVEAAHQLVVSQTLITMETPAVVVPTVHHCTVHSRAVCCHNDREDRRQSHRPDPVGGVCATLFVLHLMRLGSLPWPCLSAAGAGIDGRQSSGPVCCHLSKRLFGWKYETSGCSIISP